MTTLQQSLTAIIAIGGTRTAYSLHTGQASITDFSDYSHWLLSQYQRIISDYLELGGSHLIIPALSWQSFIQRGEKYSKAITKAVELLIGQEMCEFYKAHDLAVRCAGIDTLFQLPKDSPEHQLACQLNAFNETWNTGSHYLVWEIAPIPTYSILQAGLALDDSSKPLEALHDDLYEQLAPSVYGLPMPKPDLYIGSARNGDIKLRAMLPFALAAGGEMRFYYLPYPSLLMPREALKTILEDLQQGIADRAPTAFDYTDVLSEEAIVQKRAMVQASIERNEILGLRR
jgi:hypothetical protein